MAKNLQYGFKLMKYYNGCLFHKVEKDFLAQSGDPTRTGSGGDSVYKFLYGDQARFFNDEIRPELRHSKTCTIAMASAGENCNASQFYVTLRDDVDYLDDKHTVFGTVAEGLATLTKINEAYVDDKGRPFKDIRIKHTYILDDPFDDPPQLAELIPENSPLGKPRDEVKERLEDSWVPLDETVDPGQLEELIRSKEAHVNEVILESKACEIGSKYAKVESEKNRLHLDLEVKTNDFEALKKTLEEKDKVLAELKERSEAADKKLAEVEFCPDFEKETFEVEPYLDPIKTPVPDAMTDLKAVMSRLGQIPDRVHAWKKSATRCGGDVTLPLARVHCKEAREDKLKALQVANMKKLQFENFMETFINAVTRIADGIDLDTFVEPASPREP
ncbi:peptidyl-prolyl cis-trans isomerase CYP59-like [Hordeum vulgare subsp. vulgare]|uniref:peptidyl-prolyl cis-trans isomerase CYP59-like n=1 Tax=Hordeum vulgare subsp. vulgare TaxID=112509 RepID=UPI001D1A3B0D|nr:peptidyl-prolyl cis-trans isomerase CYP59-like [Hordeum vulgare subsp. vulgare]